MEDENDKMIYAEEGKEYKVKDLNYEECGFGEVAKLQFPNGYRLSILRVDYDKCKRADEGPRSGSNYPTFDYNFPYNIMINSDDYRQRKMLDRTCFRQSEPISIRSAEDANQLLYDIQHLGKTEKHDFYLDQMALEGRNLNDYNAVRHRNESPFGHAKSKKVMELATPTLQLIEEKGLDAGEGVREYLAAVDSIQKEDSFFKSCTDAIRIDFDNIDEKAVKEMDKSHRLLSFYLERMLVDGVYEYDEEFKRKLYDKLSGKDVEPFTCKKKPKGLKRLFMSRHEKFGIEHEEWQIKVLNERMNRWFEHYKDDPVFREGVPYDMLCSDKSIRQKAHDYYAYMSIKRTKEECGEEDFEQGVNFQKKLIAAKRKVNNQERAKEKFNDVKELYSQSEDAQTKQPEAKRVNAPEPKGKVTTVRRNDTIKDL
ncbi:MAG: hypothetical protein J6T72_04250 [Alphaproteobacteria bacterium]|nr:hypothetical protein [Alphaproteobacteria bacterium]